MNTAYLKVILQKNIRLLLRSWIFRIYILISIISIFTLQIILNEYILDTKQSPFLFSFLPFITSVSLNIFQLIPLIFLTNELAKKTKNTSYNDIISYRPYSNENYIIGLFLSVVIAFTVSSFVLTIITATINSVLANNLNLYFYCIYFLLYVIPFVIFISGISFYILFSIKNNSLGVSILFMTLLFVFYLGSIFYNILDLSGIYATNTFSDITGHNNLKKLIAERSSWIIIGFIFLFLSILNLNRISNSLKNIKLKSITVIFFTTYILIIGTLYNLEHRRIDSAKNYTESYNKYQHYLKATLLTQDITYQQKNDSIRCTTFIQIQNQNNDIIEKLVLYLNPKLKVNSITIDDKNIHYQRENQIIIIDYSLKPQHLATILVDYSGTIDENIIYLDVEDDNKQPNRHLLFSFGKDYSFLNKDYTLLIPEALWYPVTIPPVNPVSPFNISKNFSSFKLKVINKDQCKTVISQGNKKLNNDTITFKNTRNLHGITLCIGEYLTKILDVNDIKIELHIFKQHHELFKSVEFLKDDIKNFLEDYIENIEYSLGQKYPYDYFKLTETPISFWSTTRENHGYSEFVQPEISFFPEKGFNYWKKFIYNNPDETNKMDFAKSHLDVMLEIFLMSETKLSTALSYSNILKKKDAFNLKYSGNINNHNIIPTFFTHTTFVRNNEIPLFNSIFNKLIINDIFKNRSTSLYQFFSKNVGEEYKSIDLLNHNSLKTLSNNNKITNNKLGRIMDLKSNELLNIMEYENTSEISFKDFLKDYLSDYKFKTIDFDSLNIHFGNKSNLLLSDYLHDWYTRDILPTYEIYAFEIEYFKMSSESYPKSLITATLFNNSDVDGIVSFDIYYREPIVSSTSNVFTLSKSMTQETIISKRFKIEKRSGKRIAFIFDEPLSKVELNTLISNNLPRKIEKEPFYKDIDDYRPRSEYFIDFNKNDLHSEKIIIADNEDLNFSISQPSSRTKLSRWKKENEKYKNPYMVGIGENGWDYFIDSDNYGIIIKSAMVKKAKNSDSKITWKTNIPKEGLYKIFVYLPYIRFQQPYNEEEILNQYYIVKHKNGEEEITQNIYGNWRWISLGYFEFDTGEYEITLLDKGSENQILIGDAIKWTYVE